MAVSTDAARALFGYDELWERAGVLDLSTAQAQAASEEALAHPAHARWGTWRAHLARRGHASMDDDTLERLLALDASEAARPKGFGHGIVLDIAEHFVLTVAQRERVAAHATPNGLSSRTREILLRKLAARTR